MFHLLKDHLEVLNHFGTSCKGRGGSPELFTQTARLTFALLFGGVIVCILVFHRRRKCLIILLSI